jgi:hypothetical protein
MKKNNKVYRSEFYKIKKNITKIDKLNLFSGIVNENIINFLKYQEGNKTILIN